MLYVAIGHVCQDVAPEGRRLGGTVTYAALTAAALGWQAAALTRASAQLDLTTLRRVDLVTLPDAQTTTFENRYSDEGRMQILHAAAGPIRTGDVPARFRRADVIHLAPIVHEVDPALAGAFAGALIGVTPQGWLREWDAAGRVSPRAWPDAEAVLNRSDALVLSIADVNGDWAQLDRWAAQVKALAVTQGRDGCVVYTHGQRHHLPAPAVTEVDPTGAGDIFAAAFFTRLRATGDPVEAGRFANCVAAPSVTRIGLAGIPTPQDAGDCLATA